MRACTDEGLGCLSRTLGWYGMAKGGADVQRYVKGIFLTRIKHVHPSLSISSPPKTNQFFLNRVYRIMNWMKDSQYNTYI